MTVIIPPPVGPEWQNWARQLSAFLGRKLQQLTYKSTGSSASENGIILWDDISGYPVVSKDGKFRQIVLADGEANLGIATNVTAAAANTAYPLTFTLVSGSGISLGTPASRIVFEEGGQYMLSFSAQINSSSSSTVDFYFWPRVNGTDITGSTMRNSLHNNGATLVVSRSSIFTFAAGDYLEAMWATDSTSGSLEAFSATAFAPATPAATLSITRIKA
jgi:hypothetical protein